MIPERRTLGRRLMLWVVPVSLGGMVLLGVSAFYYTRLHITQSVNKELAAFSRGAAAGVGAFFRQRENDIEAISETSLLADYYNNLDYGLTEEAGQYRLELENYFKNFYLRTGVYNRVFFADNKGRPVCGIENGKPMPRGRYAGAVELAVRAGSGGTTGVRMSPVRSDPLYGPAITYAKPVYDGLQALRGVIVMEASLRPLQHILAGLPAGGSGRAYIADASGKAVLEWRDGNETGPAAPGDFIASGSVPGTDLRVILSAPMSDFQAPLVSISRVTILLVACCGLFVWGFIYLSVKGLTRPIEKLVRATRSLAEGKEFERVDIPALDEIGVLAHSFNTMGAQLTERTRDLQSRVRELLMLQGMSAEVLKNLQEENICRVCLKAAVSGLGFDRGVLYLVDQEKGLIVGRYVHSTEGVGFDESKMRTRAVPLDGGDILAEVVRGRKPLNVKDPARAPGIERRFIEELATKAFCLVPIMTERKVAGVIGVDNYFSGREISEEQMRNLGLFCNFAALALETAGLMSSVRISEERYRAVLDNSPDAIVGLDAGLRINVWNKGAQALFGYASGEISGRLVSKLFDPLAFERILREVGKNGSFTDSCVPGLDSAGGKLELDVIWAGSGETPGDKAEWTVVIRDTSEQRSTHAQLIQAEKLAAVGQLISSVAHELNNPLGAILCYADMLYKSRSAGVVTVPARDLEAIHEGAVRCAKIIKNLLLFVRETQDEKQTVSPARVVESSIGLMSYRLKKTENIRVISKVDDHIPPVLGDYTQIEQILVNLLQNACDALSHREGDKVITVSIYHHQSSVFIRVADNGPGIPAEVLERIFDPFFTTKAAGQGTGLGLPICRRIAKEHGGTITCASTPGQGAVFTLLLPIQHSCGTDSPEQAASCQLAPGGRVLVVDDEPDIAGALRRMLEAAGQSVETAGSGEEAIEKLRGGYDLIICDVELGPVKGFSVREAMLERGIGSRFIYTTGNTLSAPLLRKLKESGVPYLAKPFRLDDLYGAVFAALS